MKHVSRPIGAVLLRSILAVAVAAVSSVVAGCASTEPWGPAQIDAAHGFCSVTPTPAARTPEPAGTPVVVYGAPWCRACRSTTAYLTRRQIPFVEKDIDDMKTTEELHAILAGARIPPTTAIPVVDVRGTVMVGFSPCALEGAWATR